MSTFRRILGLGAAILGLLLVLAMLGCGSEEGAETASPSAAASVSGPAALLPADIAEKGVMRVGTCFDFPPMESYAEDGVTPIGLDVELIEGIADVLGLKVEWINMNWDGLRPALQSGRFDVIAAAMGDFTDRQKQVTFIDYLMDSELLLVRKSDAASVTSVEDLAGKKIGGARGTLAVMGMEAVNKKKLIPAGLDPIDIQVFGTDKEGVLAVQAGRTFGHFMDGPVAAYTAQTAGDGELYAVVDVRAMPEFPIGFCVRKDEMDFARAIKDALNEMISNGTYGKLLSKYDCESLGLDEAVINGGTTSSGA